MHKMHECLNDCMICGIHVGVEREIAFTSTVKSWKTENVKQNCFVTKCEALTAIAVRCNYPILPFQILEADVERLNLTTFGIVIGMRQRISVFCLRLLALWMCLSFGARVMMSDILLRFYHLENYVRLNKFASAAFVDRTHLLTFEETDHEWLKLVVTFRVH